MNVLAGLAASFACIGLAITLAGLVAVWRFARRRRPTDFARPPVTVLKPLCGDEPLLEAALGSLFQQAYPDFQIVFGVQNPGDAAIAVVERLRRRFPDRDVTLVCDATQHGSNRKVSNLINMMRFARHEVLVIADSDVHVGPGYLDALVADLAPASVGLATALYTGRPANRSLAARIGATQISHTLLPGVLLARWMGRQDCLGATMALRRETLERAGGLRMLANHLADDNVLGRLVRDTGLSVVLSPAVIATTVPEETSRALWTHELRWARTIGALEPASFGLSVLQYPLFWAAVSMASSGAATEFIYVFAAAWIGRAAAARGIDRALGLAIRSPVWLLPLRDLFSVAVMINSYLGGQVDWRGHSVLADNGRDSTDAGHSYCPEKGLKRDEDPVPASPFL